MQTLNTSDYRGHNWPGSSVDEEDSYPLCVDIFDLLVYTFDDYFF
jgi:glycogen(starch) synthase